MTGALTPFWGFSVIRKVAWKTERVLGNEGVITCVSVCVSITTYRCVWTRARAGRNHGLASIAHAGHVSRCQSGQLARDSTIPPFGFTRRHYGFHRHKFRQKYYINQKDELKVISVVLYSYFRLRDMFFQ